MLNDTTSAIARRVRRHAPRDFGVSAFVIHELWAVPFKAGQRFLNNGWRGAEKPGELSLVIDRVVRECASLKPVK